MFIIFGYFLRKTLNEENINKVLNNAFSGKLFEKVQNREAIKNIIKNIRSVIHYRFKLIEESGKDLQIKNFARQEEEFNKLIEIGEDEDYLPTFETHFKSLID